MQALNQTVLRALVENYLAQITRRGFRATRGIQLEPQDAARPLRPQRLELLADILLPVAVRQRIEKLAPECLIIVPDGVLHKLPFEALVLRSGEESAYVLDKMPPIVYAPSVSILGLLAERSTSVRTGPQSLLTVAAPNYPRDEEGGPKDPGSKGELRVWGQLAPLEHAVGESERISDLFEKNHVVKKLGKLATEKELRAALAGRHVIHIAAHGICDDHFGNQFGALLLTPPALRQDRMVDPEDDGYLALHEIYTLPLDKCELAVLSACTTNVGPQPPLEAGVTLAGGFLAAGARRVVASHWGVDDESTAELMTAFFKNLKQGARDTQTVSYAQSLQQAQRQVRKRDKWASPYYWAPFVLVGPAD